MKMHKYLKTTMLSVSIILLVSSVHAADEYYAPPTEHPVQVYFGDSHIHTRISTDAAMWGTTMGPEETYRYGLGEVATSFKGWKTKLARPLDWMVISDHSDVWGFFDLIKDGDPIVIAEPVGARWHQLLKDGNLRQVTDEVIKAYGDETLPWDVSDPKMIAPGWKLEIDAAEKFNNPGHFTAFIAYEWTSNPLGSNAHRVIIYRDDADKTRGILPFTSTGSTGSQDPEDLWTTLEAYEEKTGGQVLAIPHNGNWGGDLMFPDRGFKSNKRLDETYVTRRNRWEPLYEATQIKGDGEAHPYLSPDDEFADYETWDLSNLSFNEKVTTEMLPHQYARSGLKLGLQYQERFGVNPFQFGMVGAGDSHTGLPGQEENQFMGKHSSSEPDAERWETPFREAEFGTQEGWSEASSGLAGVWATENTRAALFDAMKRKEVYATTGTRITVRVFGGWDFKHGDDQRSDYVALGYDKGVPMGSELRRDPPVAGVPYRGIASELARKNKRPTFMVVALKDPMSGNLDRIQMVKGWHDSDGEVHEKVYDIAWGDADRRHMGPGGKIPPVGNTVNLSEATWTNTIGDVQLSTVWQDPDFDSSEQAFYYVRVLEIPTPRWTAYDSKRFGITMGEEVPMTTQERVYTSPIWYIP
jgi:hypothetical protein